MAVMGLPIANFKAGLEKELKITGLYHEILTTTVFL